MSVLILPACVEGCKRDFEALNRDQTTTETIQDFPRDKTKTSGFQYEIQTETFPEFPETETFQKYVSILSREQDYYSLDCVVNQWLYILYELK